MLNEMPRIEASKVRKVENSNVYRQTFLRHINGAAVHQMPGVTTEVFKGYL